MTEFPPIEAALPWETADGPSTTATLFFTSREDKPLNRNHFNWTWKAALEAASVITALNDKPAGRGRLWEPCRNRIMHALRHLYASERIEAGMNIHTLADRLGHADPAGIHAPSLRPRARARRRDRTTTRRPSPTRNATLPVDRQGVRRMCDGINQRGVSPQVRAKFE